MQPRKSWSGTEYEAVKQDSHRKKKIANIRGVLCIRQRKQLFNTAELSAGTACPVPSTTFYRRCKQTGERSKKQKQKKR